MALFNNKQFFTLGGVVLVVGYFIYSKTGKAINAVNPMNKENVINKGVETVFKDVTGTELNDAIWEGLTGNKWDWTIARTEQIQLQALERGEKLNPMLAQGQARYEWNEKNKSWYNPASGFSEKELNGYKP